MHVLGMHVGAVSVVALLSLVAVGPADATSIASPEAGSNGAVAETHRAADPVPAGEPQTAPAEQPSEPATLAPTLIADINLATQTMTVRVSDRQLHRWRISSGREGYRTPVGTFRPQWMARMWYSRQYDLAPMPHAVFFKAGAAIHGTAALHELGSPASHGCIRLAPANAAIFYRLVGKHGLSATRIMVHGRPPVRSDHMARRGRGLGEYQFAQTRGNSRYPISERYPFGAGSNARASGHQHYVPQVRIAPYRYERLPR